MPKWSPQELQKVAGIRAAIDGSPTPRRMRRVGTDLELSLQSAAPLMHGLAGSTRALLVRQFLQVLGFDECSHMEWRLEHKLVQALILHSYVPDLVPATSGVAGMLSGNDPSGYRSFLSREFPDGYVIKPALGDSSGETTIENRTEDILRNIGHASFAVPHQLMDEQYIVQEKLPISQEYRVHSLEDLVIEDLTFRRYTGGSIPGERDAPNAFVQSVLDGLPDSMVGGSLLAWDVALVRDAQFKIIEVNFSGFHPVYHRGFHSSGYFHDSLWGACDTARLLNHIERVDGVKVAVRADAPGYPEENRFYADVASWQVRHAMAESQVRGLWDSVETAGPGSPQWEAGDSLQMARLFAEIGKFEKPRRRAPCNAELALALSDAIPLLPALAASTRSLLTRQLLLALGFDELRLGIWRLEHKLIQAWVIEHYSPGSLPATQGLDRMVWQAGHHAKLREFLRDRFPSGFVVKTAIGDSSGEDCDYRTEVALSWIERGGRLTPQPGILIQEEFIVQERVRIRLEYRVHTVEDQVIEDLTVRRYHGAVGSGERAGPNTFVQSILDALPAGITSGSTLAWDVALLEGSRFSIIEINVGGMHTVYNPGFHSSGYYHHQHYGCVYTARLIKFVERAYGCRIHVLADAPQFTVENKFYQDVEDWRACF
jgi:hypothetical protein